MKYWNISFVKEGERNYDHVVSDDVTKVITYVCEKHGIKSSDISYLNGDGIEVVE